MWQEYNKAKQAYSATHELYDDHTIATFLYEALRVNKSDLSKEKFLSAFIGKQRPGGTEALQAWDLKNAFLLLQEKAGQRAPFTMELVQQAAAEVMKHTGREITTSVGRYDSSLGDFRLGEDYNETYPLADFRQIPELLDNLCKDTNHKLSNVNGIDVPRLAARFLYDYAYIEPFGEGNLLTGLLLMNYIQLFHNEPLIIIFAASRPDLLNALKRNPQHPSPEILENVIVMEQTAFFKRQN